MANSIDILRPDLDDHRLTEVVAELLSPVLGQSVRVDEVKRQHSPFATLSPAEVLTVVVSGGRPQVRLFLKHLGPEQPGQPDKQLRDREVRVYEELLRDPGLPVARYYGSRWNVETGRQELYLEYVDDWNLKYHDLEHWFTAARQLARFHEHFAGRRHVLQNSEILLPLDGRYFADWAERAVSVVANRSPGLAAPMRQVLGSYGRVCDVLGRQPCTLVHNDLAPKNVIADRSTTPARICFIDWELAGVGCGLLDLVHLKYGLDPANDREMVNAYRGELRGTDLAPANDRDFESVLAACELHKTLYRLAHSEALRATPSAVAHWVADARKFLKRV